VRKQAAKALGWIGSPEVVPALITAMKDPSDAVRKAAAEALGYIKSPEVVPALIAALQDSDEAMRKQAAKALGWIESPEAVPALIAAMKDPDTKGRVSAAEALGWIKSPEAVPTLIAAMKDLHKGVREAAAEVLSQINSREVVLALIAALKDSDKAMQEQAAKALGRLPSGHSRVAAATDQLRQLPMSLSEQPQLPWSPLMTYAESLFTTSTAPFFARLEATHVLTRGAILSNRRAFLGWLGRFDFSQQQEHPAEIEAAVTELRIQFPESPPESNPASALWLAISYREAGVPGAALDWAKRGLAQVTRHEPALAIALRWVEAQALLGLERAVEAQQVLKAVERDLLPRVTGVERQETGLLFTTHTATLRAVVALRLGQAKEAVQRLYQVEAGLEAEEELTIKWWDIELNRSRSSPDRERTARRQRAQKLIDGLLAEAQAQESKARAQAVVAAEEIQARNRLEQEAETYGYQRRIQAAIGEGDYETELTEKLQLKQQVWFRGGLQSAAPERQAVLTALASLQERVRHLEAELARKMDEKSPSGEAQRGERSAGGPREGARSRGPTDRDASAEAKIARLRQAQAEARRAIKQFFVDLKRKEPSVAALLGAEPTELARWQSQLSPQQAVVQYLLLEHTGWAFVATAARLEVVELPSGTKKVEPAVRQLRQALQRGETLSRGRPVSLGGEPAPASAEALARSLSQSLLDPVLAHLAPEIDHLLIVPQGPLHFLPFAALPVASGALIERYVLSLVPNTSVLSGLPIQWQRGERLLALANPVRSDYDPLPGAEREVERLAPLFPDPRVRRREEVQRAVLIGQDLGRQVVHLALHGQAGSPGRPARLILSDGDLSVSDVWGLNLQHSPLVVLSACDTALGERLMGDEVVSLHNGFLFAGAERVVASLWPIPDAATAEVMPQFYAGLSQGQDVARALAQAQRRAIAEALPPLAWAAFVAVGW